LQPIRTVSEVDVEFVVFTQEPFEFQRIRVAAARMRRLGMSFRAIGAALGVDEKTVRKALAGPAS
jgi:transposase-like protein